MIVVDASVMANALTDDGAYGDTARSELALDDDLAAPVHLLAEVFSAIRGRHLGGHVDAARCAAALAALRRLSMEDIDIRPLMARMWELRHNASGYDAAYVAAAERNSCALVTADARLAAVPGVRCEIRLAVPTS